MSFNSLHIHSILCWEGSPAAEHRPCHEELPETEGLTLQCPARPLCLVSLPSSTSPSNLGPVGQTGALPLTAIYPQCARVCTMNRGITKSKRMGNVCPPRMNLQGWNISLFSVKGYSTGWEKQTAWALRKRDWAMKGVSFLPTQNLNWEIIQ